MISIFVKHKKLIRELFLYGVFGLFSASMDTLSFYYFQKTSLPLLVSNFASVNIGICISFLLNTFINFKKVDNVSKRAIRFWTIGYIGLLLSTLFMWIGISVIDGNKMGVKICSVVVVAMVQYFLNKSITYK